MFVTASTLDHDQPVLLRVPTVCERSHSHGLCKTKEVTHLDEQITSCSSIAGAAGGDYAVRQVVLDPTKEQTMIALIWEHVTQDKNTGHQRTPGRARPYAAARPNRF